MSNAIDEDVLVLEDGSEESAATNQTPPHRPGVKRDSGDPDIAFNKLITALGDRAEPDQPVETDDDAAADPEAAGQEAAGDLGPVLDPFAELDQTTDWDTELALLIDGLETEIRAPQPASKAHPLEEQIADAISRSRSADDYATSLTQFPLVTPSDETGRIGFMLAADKTPVQRTELGLLPLVDTRPTTHLPDIATLHAAIIDAIPVMPLVTQPPTGSVQATATPNDNPVITAYVSNKTAVSDTVGEPEQHEQDEVPVALLNPLDHPDIALADDANIDEQADEASPIEDSTSATDEQGWVTKSGLRLAIDEVAPSSDGSAQTRAKTPDQT
ncbi:MAG: hypothetical protein AAF556_13175, partial [Pseudomonadota bacterium]